MGMRITTEELLGKQIRPSLLNNTFSALSQKIMEFRAFSTENRPRPAKTTTQPPKSSCSLRDIIRTNHATSPVESNEAAEGIVGPKSDEQEQKRNKKKTKNQGKSKTFKQRSQRPGRV